MAAGFGIGFEMRFVLRWRLTSSIRRRRRMMTEASLDTETAKRQRS